MIGWAVETLVASSVLMLLVLAIRAPIRNAFGPNAAYALWLLPALRMVLPPIPDNWRPVDIAPIGAATEPGTIMFVVPIAHVPALPQGWGMATIPVAIVALWLVGAIAFLGYHLTTHRRFCRRVLASGSVRTVAAGHVRVIETPAAAGPLAFGVLRRYVAMPADFADRYDPQERTLALAHELGHHARGDLLANWAALACLALHWFNPVAWRAYRAFRADQELACDAMVLARATPGLRHAYARAIVKSAHGGAVSAACHLHGINELKGRLRMLSKHRVTTPARRIGGAAGIAAIAVATLGMTASGTHAAETIRTRVETATGIDLAQIETQAALLAPAIAAQVAPATAAPVEPAPPAPPQAPAPVGPASAPAAPERPAQPVTPTAPNAPTTIVLRSPDVDGTHGVRQVVVRRAGLPEGTALSAIAIPKIIERECGTDAQNKSVIVHEQGEDGQRRIILCTDRRIDTAKLLEQSARNGAGGSWIAHLNMADAAGSRRMGLDRALAGLRSARASIEREDQLSASRKREALKGIDRSIREIEAERGTAR